MYADWVVKVYERCNNKCIRKGHLEGDYAKTLREVEMQCGRNCIRKYDKVYKLWEALEPKILEQHCEE